MWGCLGEKVHYGGGNTSCSLAPKSGRWFGSEKLPPLFLGKGSAHSWGTNNNKEPPPDFFYCCMSGAKDFRTKKRTILFQINNRYPKMCFITIVLRNNDMQPSYFGPKKANILARLENYGIKFESRNRSGSQVNSGDHRCVAWGSAPWESKMEDGQWFWNYILIYKHLKNIPQRKFQNVSIYSLEQGLDYFFENIPFGLDFSIDTTGIKKNVEIRV